MNWVDLLILMAAAGAAAFGVLRGGAAQLISYAGFAAGLLLGAAVAPPLTRVVGNAPVRSVLGFTLPFVLAILLSTVGRKQGQRFAASLRTRQAQQTDRAVGGAFGVVVTLVGAWLVAGMLGPIGLPTVSAAIGESAIARTLTERLPPAPLALARLQQIVIPEGVPPMLAELEPSPAPDVPVASDDEVEAAVRAARASTVEVIARGCGRTATGTGFVAAEGVVVTNAHVVAGVDDPVVEDRRGRHRARIVLFDPATDFAVLRVSGLAGKPLPLVDEQVERGQRGAVLGFPGGGPFRAEPGAVLAVFDSLEGRNIYGDAEAVSREVYQLKAQVRNGNSGGPFVTADGEVAGVIFSASAINENIGYALSSTGVAPLLQEALRTRAAVPAGPCPARG